MAAHLCQHLVLLVFWILATLHGFKDGPPWNFSPSYNRVRNKNHISLENLHAAALSYVRFPQSIFCYKAHQHRSLLAALCFLAFVFYCCLSQLIHCVSCYEANHSRAHPSSMLQLALLKHQSRTALPSSADVTSAPLFG